MLQHLQYICNMCLPKTIKTRCAKFLQGSPTSKLCSSMTLTHTHFATEILYCLKALAVKIDVQYIFPVKPTFPPKDTKYKQFKKGHSRTHKIMLDVNKNNMVLKFLIQRPPYGWVIHMFMKRVCISRHTIMPIGWVQDWPLTVFFKY